MRKLLIIAVLFIAAVSANAQGIEFFHGTYKEALKEAEKQGKKGVFMDFYTVWCGPCKHIAKSVFTRKEVGDFYNKHFICMKVDAEKGEGPELAKKFEIKGYPTFKYVKPDGSLLRTASSFDAGTPKDLIKTGKMVLGMEKEVPWSWWEQQYKSGRNDTKFLEDYANENYKRNRLMVDDELAIKIINSYPKDKRFKYTNNLWRVWNKAYPGNEFYDFILENREDFKLLLSNGHSVALWANVNIEGDSLKGKDFKKTEETFINDFSYYKDQIKAYRKANRYRLDKPNGHLFMKYIFEYMDRYGKPSYAQRLLMSTALNTMQISERQAKVMLDINAPAYHMAQDHMWTVVFQIVMTYKSGDKKGAIEMAKKHKSLADQNRGSKMTYFVKTIDTIAAGGEPTVISWD